MKTIAKYQAAIAISLIAFCLLIWIGMSDFYTRGEAREALVAQSMVLQNEYFLPKSYNDAIPSKPPLFHWLAVVSSILIGEMNEFSLRLPSALLSVGTLFFFLFFVGSELDKPYQLLFIVFLSFSFEWLRASSSARVDMVHAAMLSCGLLSMYQALTQNKLRFWLTTAAFLALATLGKGPVALILSALIILFWLLYKQGPKEVIKKSPYIGITLIVASSIAFSWYYVAYTKHPQEFTEKVWAENFARFGGTMSDTPHRHSAIYLIGMLGLGTLPWSLLVIYCCWKNRPKSLGDLKIKFNLLSELEQFSIVASLIILFFYCIPASKRGVYLLACYPFLAYLASALIQRTYKLTLRSLWITIITCCVIVSTVQIALMQHFIAARMSERILAYTIANENYRNDHFYSYGFEFYGASFYSKKKFLRLEDQLNSSFDPLNLTQNNSLIIFFPTEFSELQNSLEKNKVALKVIKEIPLKSTQVLIAKPTLIIENERS